MRDSVRRVGQRVVVGFRGLEASVEVRELIRGLGVGHVILFSRNVADPGQVAELVRDLQETARRAGHDLPLMVSVDQEGGRVQRLRGPWTAWPPLRAVGRTGSEEIARRMGAGLASELKACGIACDFAPVVDVDTNPDNPVIGDRSFGDDPDLVGRLGRALAAGLESGGVAACAKHFPGHGDTRVDSHLELPVVEHGRGRLDDVELRPFRMLSEAGVSLVMTAHVLVPELDAERPATLSERIVAGVLRGEIGYRGVVVSDDMEMKAIAARYAPGPAAVMAARAGCDLIAVCDDAAAQVEAIEALVRAVESGEIGWKPMEDAVGRIARLKERFVLPYRDPDPREAWAAAGSEPLRAVAAEIADRGGVPA